MGMMMHNIMINTPNTYDNLNDRLDDSLGTTNDPLTLETLIEKLSEKYEKMKARKGFKSEESDSDQEENALFAEKQEEIYCKMLPLLKIWTHRKGLL